MTLDIRCEAGSAQARSECAQAGLRLRSVARAARGPRCYPESYHMHIHSRPSKRRALWLNGLALFMLPWLGCVVVHREPAKTPTQTEAAPAPQKPKPKPKPKPTHADVSRPAKDPR